MGRLTTGITYTHSHDLDNGPFERLIGTRIEIRKKFGLHRIFYYRHFPPCAGCLQLHAQDLVYPQSLPDAQVKHNLLTTTWDSICPNVPV